MSRVQPVISSVLSQIVNAIGHFLSSLARSTVHYAVWSILTVPVTYNENSNVIMMATEGASQMRGSGFLEDKQLFLGYRPMGLSRNSAR